MRQLVTDVEKELKQCSYLRNTKITVTGINGNVNEIVLEGSVNSFFHKQMAQQQVLSIVQGSDFSLRNELAVRSYPSRWSVG